MTLLEDAQNVRVRSKFEVTKEEEKLAIAWAQEQITLKQVAVAYRKRHGKASTNGVYSLLARALKKHIGNKD